MNLLPLILIALGYVALVVTAGPIGLGLVVLHLLVMLAAAHVGRRRRRPKQ